MHNVEFNENETGATEFMNGEVGQGTALVLSNTGLSEVRAALLLLSENTCHVPQGSDGIDSNGSRNESTSSYRLLTAFAWGNNSSMCHSITLIIRVPL